jgi:hypothetical protein
MTVRHLLLLGILAVQSGRAQTAKTEFDVASVKPSAPDKFNSFAIRNAPGGRVQLLGAPLRMILMEAYDMRTFQILRLVARKGPVGVLVIEGVEKPSPN